LFAVALVATALGSCSDQQPVGPEIVSRCLETSLPADTQLTLIGVYEGERGNDGQSSQDEVRPVRLGSGWRTKPQVVVVMAYDPVLWDFSGVSADKVRGVITYGYAPQQVTGLPSGIPLRQINYDAGKAGSPRCGDYLSVHKGGPELDQAVAQIERVSGLTVTRFHGAYRAAEMSLDGDGQWPAPDPGTYLMAESGPFAGDDPREQPDHRPGDDVVATLVGEGFLRPATQDDIDAWNERATQSLKTGKLAAYASEYLQRPAAYVVLKPLPRHPTVLFRSFIYPADIPAPAAPDTQNGEYFMKTGTCRGNTPDCQKLSSKKASASSPWSIQPSPAR